MLYAQSDTVSVEYSSTSKKTVVTRDICLCSAASADLVEKSQAAQKLLKVVIAGLSEDAHSEEVRKVLSVSSSKCWFIPVVPARKQDTVLKPVNSNSGFSSSSSLCTKLAMDASYLS